MSDFSLNIGFRQDVGVSQQLNLAPQLLQWLKLLQVSATDLNQLVQTELTSNPALEVDDNIPSVSTDKASKDVAPDKDDSAGAESVAPDKVDVFSAGNDDSYDNWVEPQSYSAGTEAQEKYDYVFNSVTESETLYSHLEKQAGTIQMNAPDREIVTLIIGSLNDRGYLSVSVEDLASIAGVDVKEIERLLNVVQGFDPAGVGARDLKECLLLQIGGTGDNSLVRQIVSSHLDALARKQYAEIALALGVAKDEVFDAADFIKQLDPCPGSAFGSKPTEYVDPDVFVNKFDGEYVVELSEGRIPKLRISNTCQAMLGKKNLSPSEVSYLRSRIRAASFLIQGISQRRETLKKVAEQIVSAQREYFDVEDGKLKPLTMAKVAAIVGVHETTVSRAIANKYISTPRGLFEMKKFFVAGYKCADGSALTPDSIKDRIEQLVTGEASGSSLRDVDIVKILKEQGITIARRTVAKYRGELGLSSSKERKKENAPLTGWKPPVSGKRQDNIPEDQDEQPELLPAQEEAAQDTAAVA